MEPERSGPLAREGRVASLFWITIFSACAYILMEWLFTVTRPSFLDGFSTWDKLDVLLSGASLAALALALLNAPLLLLGRASGSGRLQGWLIWLGALLPAGVLAAMFLLWIDNFTYTIFKWGIVSTSGPWRGAYALLFLLLIVLCCREVLRLLPGLSRRLRGGRRKRSLLWASLFILFLPAGLLAARTPDPLTAAAPRASAAKSRPNILLLTSDGVNAENMSLYGYRRDTTPFLKELARTSLVAENALTNAAKTYGSVLSFYTGKNPVTTRTIFAPNILKGADSYQHLPGLLRSAGYRTVEITTPRYADAITMNLLEGFDEVNGQAVSSDSLLSPLNRYLPSPLAYFLSETSTRITSRLGHIFYLKTMENPYALVTGAGQNLNDTGRMRSLIEEIETSEQPLFAHVHFMSTHGPKFSFHKAVFSSGGSNFEAWDTDLCDDSILDFDRRVRELVDFLAQDGSLDSTLIIIASDHGAQWATDRRLPLLIHFPGGEHTGRIQAGVQMIDIAPTILASAGMEIPTWMEGEPLLQIGGSPRPIFSVESVDGVMTEQGWSLEDEVLQPPFYQFSAVRLSYCQRWYRLNLTTLQLTQGEISGYTSPCPHADLPTPRQALILMAGFFEERGFDASSIRVLAGE